MAVSVFDLFKIGIGPSSSHTVGPMRAAAMFAERLAEQGRREAVARVTVELFGSLGHTGRGHGTDRAVVMGLEGEQPDRIDPNHIPRRMQAIAGSGSLRLAGVREIVFDLRRDLVFHKRKTLPHHPNGMRFTAMDREGQVVRSGEYYSIGGGFVLDPDDAAESRIVADDTPQPYPFATAEALLQICRQHDLRIAEVMMANECVWRSQDEVVDGLMTIWQAMQDCVKRGLGAPVICPGR